MGCSQFRKVAAELPLWNVFLEELANKLRGSTADKRVKMVVNSSALNIVIVGANSKQLLIYAVMLVCLLPLRHTCVPL